MSTVGSLVFNLLGNHTSLTNSFAVARKGINSLGSAAGAGLKGIGGSFMSVIAYGVLPQVFARFIGFCTYQLDSNLRYSTMVGIVGAGGIGGTLFAAFQRFDYDYVCAILISIIALIMVGEVLATYVRAIFIDGLSFADMFHRRPGAPSAPRERLLEDE